MNKEVRVKAVSLSGRQRVSNEEKWKGGGQGKNSQFEIQIGEVLPVRAWFFRHSVHMVGLRTNRVHRMRGVGKWEGRVGYSIIHMENTMGEAHVRPRTERDPRSVMEGRRVKQQIVIQQARNQDNFFLVISMHVFEDADPCGRVGKCERMELA
jgi:hypothetical protein